MERIYLFSPRFLYDLDFEWTMDGSIQAGDRNERL